MTERITVIRVSAVPRGSKPAAGTARTLFRLALGAITLGREALGQGEAQIADTVATAQLAHPGETDADRARFAAIGAAAGAAGAVQAGFSLAGRAANGALYLGGRILRPVTGSRLMQPARQRFERYEARGEQILQGWIASGRSEEAISRAMAQQTGTAAIEEVLDYLAVSPEMDELVAQQSQDMAGEMVDEIRARTTKIFVFRDWFAAAILRRPPSRPPGTSGKTGE